MEHTLGFDDLECVHEKEETKKKNSRYDFCRAKSAPLFNTKSIGRLVKEAHVSRITDQNRKITARLQFPGEPRSKSVTSLYIELLSPRRHRGCTRCSTKEEKDVSETKPRVSGDEMDEIIQRLNRPTFMSSARAVSAKRPWRDNNARKPSKENVDYLTMVHPDRFSGKTPLCKERVERIVNRLYRPSLKHRNMVEKQKPPSQFGIVQSYAWQGIKNW